MPTPENTDPFALPPHLEAKADPGLIGADRAHFAAVSRSLSEQRATLETRLDAERSSPAGSGQDALDRDLQIRRLSARLRLLQRFGVDLCIGRMTSEGGDVYIGRLGLTGLDGRLLLMDWRAPAAAPYFAATRHDPQGVSSRRRYRWANGKVVDYWDEVFASDASRTGVALDDESAFIASLSVGRSSRMRDVLSTIQADQHAIVRAPSRGALIVDGGPGTGKTVVALHRAAHLLYAEPHLTHGGGGMLFVAPHPAFLAYVEDVLPNLGEESVRMCTMRDLVPEGAAAADEPDAEVARLKGRLDPIAIVEAAVRYHETPPTVELTIASPWGELRMTGAEWTEAFTTADPGTPHDEARDTVWEAVCDILVDQLDDPDVSPHTVHRWLRREDDLVRAFTRAWPLLDPPGVVADLWSVPAYLRLCAPYLHAEEIAMLQRTEPRVWSVADLPFLDAARQRIGDPEAVRGHRRRAAAAAAAPERLSHDVDDLIAGDDNEMKVMSILRGDDARTVMLDVDALARPEPDALAGPFAHVVVDEAQELTDAQWRTLLHRCPSRSLTIVGDRTQARRGFTESWDERLARIGLRDVRLAPLTINYRTPAEIMSEAEPVIRAAVPDANVPVSVRRSGVPVLHGVTSDRDAILGEWLRTHDEGMACVIGDPAFAGTERVRSLTPQAAKGLEFDLVVLVDPDRFGDDTTGAVDRYVAMTRSTGRLAVLRPSGHGNVMA